MADNPKDLVDFVTWARIKVNYVVFLALFGQFLSWIRHYEGYFWEGDTPRKFIVKLVSIWLREDKTDVVDHLHLFVLLGTLFLSRRVHKFGYHLSIFFNFNFLCVGIFNWLALSRLIFLFQVLGLVVVASAFLHIYLHFGSNSPDGWGFPNSWPPPHNQGEEGPLILPDVLIDAIGFLSLHGAEHAIFLGNHFVFVFEEGVHPLLDLLAGRDIEQLRNLFRSVLRAP